MRNQRLDYAYYAKRASGTALCRARPAEVWAVVTAIGGENGYYYLDSLWTLRAAMDWAIGGPGLKRGRRHPSEVRVGDRIDSWQVMGVEPERRLSLAFCMKAPGAGMLEFDLEPVGERGTRITVTAYWHPAGAAGLAYWYTFAPAHKLLFDGMTREICKRARALPARPVTATTSPERS